MKFLIASLLFANILAAQTLSVGDSYPSFRVNDQFERSGKVYRSDEIVIMTFEKDVSGELNSYLHQKSAKYLEENKVKYIADISGMPGIITKMFALPKMKKYKYRLLLINDGEQGEQFPRKDELVSVFKIKDYRIESIDFMTPKEVIDFIDKK